MFQNSVSFGTASVLCKPCADRSGVLGICGIDKFYPVQTGNNIRQHFLPKLIAAAVTGIAGPLGDGSDTPVGTVWVAVAQNGLVKEQKFHFEGTRAEVRMKAAAAVLEELLNAI